jgi:hypothetical protein
MTIVDLPMNWVYGTVPVRLRRDGVALAAGAAHPLEARLQRAGTPRVHAMDDR